MTASRVVLYTAVYCRWCWRARAMLDDAGIAYEVHDITVDLGERRRLARETGRRTVPHVFVDGAPIGGHDELAAMLRSGELA
jgi:glutaredoxin 3